MVQVTSPTNLAIDSPQGRKLFVFDRVFDEDITQEGIWDYLSESVSSFAQGYNVSMLAYGQSGAGKSYTMGTSGPGEQADLDIMGTLLLIDAIQFWDHLTPPRTHLRIHGLIYGNRCNSTRSHGTI
jgi:hypothetical protein